MGAFVGLGDTGAADGRIVGLGDTGDAVGLEVDGKVVVNFACSVAFSRQGTPQEQGQLSISSSTCCRVKPMSKNKAQSKKPCPSHPRPMMDI